MFLDAISGIVADIPDAVERHIKQIGTYVEQAASGLGSWVAHNPNEFIIACSAAATAVFTFVLATKTAGLFRETSGLRESTDKLWAAGERQLELIEENAQRQSHEMQTTIGIALGANDIAITNAELQLRAYVHLKSFEVREILHPWAIKGMHATTPTLFLTWENSGQTPTRNMLSSSNWREFPQGIPGDFQFPDDADNVPFTGMLGPRQTTELNPKLIPADVLKKAAEKKTRIYVWGWVEYDDIFGGTNRHRTEFSAELTVTGLPGHTCHYGVTRLSRYNTADGDCLRPYHPHTNKYA